MADPDGADAPEKADDLFGRWREHRGQDRDAAGGPSAPQRRSGDGSGGGARPDLDWLALVRDPGSRYREAKTGTPEEPPAGADPGDDPVTPDPEAATPAPVAAPAVSWVDRMRANRQQESAAGPEPESEAEPDPEPAPQEITSATTDWRQRFQQADAPDEPAVDGPRTVAEPIPDPYEFTPRLATRRVVTGVFVAGIVATAYLARAAYDDPDQTSIALAAAAAFATAVLWAVRGTTTITRMRVEQGRLEVVRDGARSEFDLTSATTPLEVVGTPGRRGWQALLHREHAAPLVIDSSIVDPVEFMRVVRYHRPGQAPGTPDS